MMRRLWASAALTAGLTLSGAALAQDNDTVKLSRFQPKAGGFAGAVQSAAEGAEVGTEDSDETEKVCCRRKRYCGYGGYYRSYYPSYVVYSVPRVYYPVPVYSYAAPVYSYPPTPYYTSRYSYHQSYSYSYSGPTPPPSGATTAARPPVAAMTLGNPRPAESDPGPLRYDGGPMNPIPLPTPDQPGTTPPPTISPAEETSRSLSISVARKPTPKPTHKYPAYGSKK